MMSMFGNKAHLEPLSWAASFHLCMIPHIESLHVCDYICVCLQSSHASRHGCFLLSCGSPFVFSSGCWLLSRRCCSSCCSTLSSTGNFWSCWSSFSLCSPSQGCCLAIFFKPGATVVKLRCWFEWLWHLTELSIITGQQVFFSFTQPRDNYSKGKKTILTPWHCLSFVINDETKELSGYETLPIESLMLLLQFPHFCTFHTPPVATLVCMWKNYPKIKNVHFPV